VTGQGDPDRRGRAIKRFASTRHSGGDWSPLASDDQDALAEVTAFWRGLDQMSGDTAIQAMRAQALDRLPGQPATMKRSAWRAPALSALAASVLAAVAIGSLALRQERSPVPGQLASTEPEHTLANGKGVPRSVTLRDGSRLTLDTQTNIRLIGWSQGRRLVSLDQGRAFFAVRHDPSHPFTVEVSGTTVTDVGTQFEIQRTPGGTTITLAEGQVHVDARGSPGITMTAGHRLTIDKGRWTVSQIAERSQVTWRDGMLDVDNRPASEVVAALNRYLARPLVLRDAAAGRIRISGTFRLDDPGGFEAALTVAGHPGLVREEDSTTG
jgi:transmembrane sensor